MNEKLTMTLKWLSYVALFFCAVWFVFLCYQSYHQVFDTTGSHIHWEAKQNQVLFVSTVFLLYIALTLVVIGLCVAFFINLIKGIQYEELFPKKNIRLIFIAIHSCNLLSYSFLVSCTRWAIRLQQNTI